MVLMEGEYLRTAEKGYHQMAHFFTKIFALIFGIGMVKPTLADAIMDRLFANAHHFEFKG
jgi:cytochrome bd-type quinol oxidase subunit 1